MRSTSWYGGGGAMAVAERLSANFTRAEFACQDHCGFGLGPDDVSPRLVDGLQALRDRLGAAGCARPVRVLSGCRCVARNTLVGGGVHSRHLLGWAADIWVDGMTARELYAQVIEIPAFAAGGVGVSDEGGFVHVDVREGDLARQAAPDRPVRWCYREGKEAGWYEG